MSENHVIVSLDAVIVTVAGDVPKILVVGGQDTDPPLLPSGLLDPGTDRTLELGLRRWLALQTGIDAAYVEQLYTFGDSQRSAAGTDQRELAIGYVALVAEETPAPGSRWIDTYDMFPWEDHRQGSPQGVTGNLISGLTRWAGGDPVREARINITFGIDALWDPIRVLERYELLYEAGLVAETYADRGTKPPAYAYGQPLGRDHRRIVATALGRIRGKLTYRPVVFEVLPDAFTLTELQLAVEALVGIELHKQNFRRLVERGNLVEATGDHRTATGGRPAALFRFRSEVVSERPRPGFPLPRPRQL